jgi:hypothetical protein
MTVAETSVDMKPVDGDKAVSETSVDMKSDDGDEVVVETSVDLKHVRRSLKRRLI